MLQLEKCGLMVVDVQGKLARMVHESEKIIANTAILIQACKVLSLPIIWLEQYPQGLGETVPELSLLLADYQPLTKHTFNGCADSAINKAIVASGRQQWLVCGIEAHVCVYQTAMGLLAQNYHVEVVADCVSSRLASNIELALAKLRGKGAEITAVEMCIYELVKDSQSPLFKQILPFIK
ncbi:MAG: hydrolase [Porticoccaceae bacterium]|jgi:nicotinamidase-related amidase|nr:hydrolase [Porticoccaceae bacterium]